MPDWYYAEQRRETDALTQFRQAVLERARKDPNPYIRALATPANDNTEYRNAS